MGMKNRGIFLTKLGGYPFFQIQGLNTGLAQGFIQPPQLRIYVNVAFIKNISKAVVMVKDCYRAGNDARVGHFSIKSDGMLPSLVVNFCCWDQGGWWPGDFIAMQGVKQSGINDNGSYLKSDGR